MPMDFPANPTVDQTYSVSGGPTYKYDGQKWKIADMNVNNADTLDGHHASDFSLTSHSHPDKIIISTGDPDPGQGSDKWLWLKV